MRISLFLTLFIMLSLVGCAQNGEKPYKDLTSSDIISATVTLSPPNTTIKIEDVEKLVSILQRLASGGNSVIVIEHNLDVIKSADHIIDLGPEGGDGGGYVVASGTPEEVARIKESYTGQYLKQYL